MADTKMDETIQTEIRALRKQPVAALKLRYRELFGEASASANKSHLIRRIGWRLQAIAEGDLTERARRRAAELAADADLRLRPPRSFYRKLEGKEDPPPSPRDERLPAVGRVLHREYRGCVLRVTVLEQGYEYDGRQYTSLSSIAYQVTGTRWNGFAFFRLGGRERHG